MLNQELTPAIFTRKSIRKWADAPLSQAQLEEIRAVMQTLIPLFPKEKIELELKPHKGGDAQRLYIYCENTVAGNINAGFMVQQLDLAAHLRGFGSLWFGMGRAPKDIKPNPPLSYLLCMKLGNAAEPLARKSVSEFDRKPIGEVIAEPALQPLLEAVRLAPSATNSQPWLFRREGNLLHAYCKKPNPLMAKFVGRMNQNDIGIALCHAVLALEQAGKTVTGGILAAPKETPNGYYYAASLAVEW
jgi:nitroreductase